MTDGIGRKRADVVVITEVPSTWRPTMTFRHPLRKEAYPADPTYTVDCLVTELVIAGLTLMRSSWSGRSSV